MSVSYVEREQADDATLVYYDRAESRFAMLLNIFKVLGHTPELGSAFTTNVMAILKDAELPWITKELLILKTTHNHDCRYCVVQHETLGKRLGIPEEKIADLPGYRYRNSPHFTDPEKALLDLAMQIFDDANDIPDELWERLRDDFTEAQIVEAVYTISTYIAVSKIGDALGVGLEPIFSGVETILDVEHG